MRRLVRDAALVGAAIGSMLIFLSVDSHSHSVSDTLMGAAAPIGLVWLAALAVIFVVARTMKSS